MLHVVQMNEEANCVELPEEQSCPPGLYTNGLLAVVQRCKGQLLSDFTLPSVSFRILQEKVLPSSIPSYYLLGCYECSHFSCVCMPCVSFLFRVLPILYVE